MFSGDRDDQWPSMWETRCKEKDAELTALRKRVEELETDRYGLMNGWEQERGTSNALRAENERLKRECPHRLMRRFENGNRECVDCGERFGPLEDENRALRAERDALKGQLCETREVLKNRMHGEHLPFQHGRLPMGCTCRGCIEIIEVLSSSSPCPHAEKVEKLKEAVHYGILVLNACGRPDVADELRRRRDEAMKQ